MAPRMRVEMGMYGFPVFGFRSAKGAGDRFQLYPKKTENGHEKMSQAAPPDILFMAGSARPTRSTENRKLQTENRFSGLFFHRVTRFP
jgi:hypothetical protein